MTGDEGAGGGAPLAGGHRIEVAKTGRASCRTCRQGIAKGELRFGEETFNVFGDRGGTMYRWHHLACAATKLPHEVREALSRFEGEVPNRAELEREIDAAAAKKRPKPPGFPYAERSATGRSKCQTCGEPIAKDTLRIAIERPLEMMGMGTTGAAYLHPACAAEHAGDAAFVEKLRANSAKLLSPADLEEVLRDLKEAAE